MHVKVAQLAPLAESVPPRRYGGTERVVSWLTEELVDRGHDVTLFASADSITSAKLCAGAPRSLRRADVGDQTPYHLMLTAEVFERASEFDLVHSHIDYLAFPFTRFVDVPTVHTLHGRLDLPQLPRIYARYPELTLVSISDAQRRPIGMHRFAATIHHGLPRDLYSLHEDPDDYFLFIGRVSPEKGPLLAIEAAKRAGVRLLIAAKVDPADRAVFEREVRPASSHPSIEFLDEVSDAEKKELIGNARAVLAPIEWPEPFGLVFIEALASGTPVITRPCGSVPEVLKHGRTALIGSTLDELVHAIHRIDSIDRRVCRAEFEARFTVERMADDYERVYGQAIERHRARAAEGSARG